MGWILQQHGLAARSEFGFDERFDAMVAGIVAHFLRQHDLRRERCWIATLEGEPVGCVFLVRRSRTTAQLRLLWVDRRARGLGIGSALVRACVAFARRAGYSKMVLGTDDVAVAARSIYAAAGFQRVAAKPHRGFGRKLVGETWELDL
jgi:GNAT superfamily N-acetyltransferase